MRLERAPLARPSLIEAAPGLVGRPAGRPAGQPDGQPVGLQQLRASVKQYRRGEALVVVPTDRRQLGQWPAKPLRRLPLSIIQWLSYGLLGLGLLMSPARAGQTLRVAEDRLPRSFNPLYADSLVDIRLTSLLFAGLFQEDRFHKVQPELAADIVLDPEKPNTFLVTLKPRLKWHNYQPVTSEDVKFTIETLLNPKVASPLADQVADIESVETRGAQQLRITFRHATPEPARLLTFPILPAQSLRVAPMSRTHAFRLRPLGAGPYAMDTFDTRGNINLSRHVAYVGGTPIIPNVQLLEMRDKQIQMEALRFGNLEVVVRVLPRDLPDLERQRKLELRPYQTNNWWYLAFNLRKSPWSDPNIRQALGALIDVDRLLEPLGGGERVTGPFVPSSPFYNHSEQVPKLKPDLSLATRLLNAAGYTRQPGGFWTRQGVPLSLKLALERDQPVAREVSINLEGQLKRAGIDVTLQALSPAEWEEQVLNAHTFDVSLSQWSFDRSEDIFEQFHSTGRLNYGGYRHVRVDQLLERARREIDPSARRQCNQEVHRLLAEQKPYLFLWTLTQYAAFSAEVQDVSIDPFTFYSQVHRWKMSGTSAPRKEK